MPRVFSAALGVFLATSVLSVTALQPSKLVPAKAAASKGTTNPGLLPGTRSSVFTTIQGNALNSTNGALRDAPIRLRDVRFGPVVEISKTDKAGLFAFRGVDPGSYVVELMDSDQRTLAASQILSVEAGQTVSTFVKLPFRIPPFGGLFGHTAASAAAVASAAAASGVLAVAVTGAEASPNGKPGIR